jgi:hypothetical protein
MVFAAFRGCRLSGFRSKQQIVGAVGNQLVPKRLFDLVAVDSECTGHAFNIAGGRAHEMAGEPSREHAKDALAIDVLPPMGAHQAKGFIEPPFYIAEARHVGQGIGREEALGFCFVGQMDERKADAPRFDRVFLLGQRGDRLAAKRSAEVPQKNKEQRRFHRKTAQRLSGLRKVGIQQRCINGLRAGHAYSSGKYKQSSKTDAQALAAHLRPGFSDGRS